MNDSDFEINVWISGDKKKSVTRKYDSVAETVVNGKKYQVSTSTQDGASRMPGKCVFFHFKSADGSESFERKVSFHSDLIIFEDFANDVGMISVFEKKE